MKPDVEWNLGETIKNLRLRSGITQEALSEEIVDPSTISRYENGSQMPTRRNFRLLMERLGAKGFSYGDFTDYESYILKELRDELCSLMRTGNLDTVEEKLDTLLSYAKNDDPDVLQYVGFFMLCFTDESVLKEEKLLYLLKHRLCDRFPIVKREENRIKECHMEFIRLLRLTCKWYTDELIAEENPEGKTLSEMLSLLQRENERIEKKVFTFSEQRLINAIGISLARMKKFKSALFHFLMNSGNANTHAHHNNIALCCAYLGKPEFALSRLKITMKNLMPDSDIISTISIYRSISRIFAHKGYFKESGKYVNAIRCIFELHGADLKMSFEEFMISSDFMQMY